MVNINDIATVKLTVYGRSILGAYVQDLELETGMEMIHLKYSKDGMFSTELWSIMHIFGRNMMMHSEQVFVDNKICINNRL